MKKKFLSLILAATSSFAVRADLPENWSTNVSGALSAPGTNPPPILVYFTASWCGPCKLMTRTTLTDSAVTQALAGVDHVAVDIDEHSDLAARLGVDAVPTFILLSADSETDRSTGFRPVADFLDWLTNGITKAQEDSRRLAAARQDLAEVDQLLDSRDTNSTRIAAGKLFDLCAGHDNALVPAAVARLKKLARRDPAAVLDGLNDTRLACRIQTANALRSIIGDSFNVDPWGDPAALRLAVGQWQVKLARRETDSEKQAH
jgi:thioredoxin-like negative regulator of GroEL